MVNILYVALAAATATALTPNKLVNIGRYTGAVPYSPSFQDNYSILKHVGHLGPYTNRASFGIGRDPPDGCVVDQAIMIRRHGERYPQPQDKQHIKAALQSLYGSNLTQWKGDLAFLDGWDYWVDDDGVYGLETHAGPYNGLLTTYKHGAEYRVRYGHLWDQKKGSAVPMWSSDYERVIQTARKFGEGFFGWNYTSSAALNLISESEKMGANSLTPQCSGQEVTSMCDDLTFSMPVFNVAADRFNKQNPGLKLNATDIYWLMFQSVFELTARGYSDWTNAFTLDEWVSFGYTQDLSFYYCAGPGDPDKKAVGAVYANASLALLNQGPEKTQPLVFSFSHDTNITPILVALGILIPEKDLPLQHVPFPNIYDIGNIMPMGGHLTIERMACNATAISKKDTYVRIVLNEAVVPFSSCQDGPGYSCSLANYTAMLNKTLPDFVSTCKLNSSVPHHLSFWWDYNTTTEHNIQHAQYIPYQGETSV